VDRLTRKQLKTDKFALEVEHTVDFVSEHRKEVIRYSVIGVVVAIIVLAVYFGHAHQVNAREAALRHALKVQDALVGTHATDAMLAFPTEQAKEQAKVKALTEVANQYAGTDQGEIARYYLGTDAADHGNLAMAQKCFEEVSNRASADYASLAKLALAPIYGSEGKYEQGKQLLQSLVDHPTLFVSKDEATIELAKYISDKNPEEARKLLDPLRADRSAISRAALTALADVPQK
jgi:predicted negative regulator of RcsB-dependent stress response